MFLKRLTLAALLWAAVADAETTICSNVEAIEQVVYVFSRLGRTATDAFIATTKGMCWKDNTIEVVTKEQQQSFIILIQSESLLFGYYPIIKDGQNLFEAYTIILIRDIET